MYYINLILCRLWSYHVSSYGNVHGYRGKLISRIGYSHMFWCFFNPFIITLMVCILACYPRNGSLFMRLPWYTMTTTGSQKLSRLGYGIYEKGHIEGHARPRGGPCAIPAMAPWERISNGRLWLSASARLVTCNSRMCTIVYLQNLLRSPIHLPPSKLHT
jgi:hypothetical protein